VVPALAPINPVGTLLGNVNVLRTPDNRNLLQFATQMGRTYYVQYSDDGGANWTTVLSPVIGTGNNYAWLDNGPPKTITDSRLAPNRLYRVVLLA